jgi:hypothetical protein
MTDLSGTIIPKSDQLNADDLIAGPRTIRVSRVTANPDSAEQPVSVFFDGDGGKPYKPCKSMRRVLVACWGADGSAFAGRSMTLYRDPSVTWGGLEVGGIRISHLSHIEREMTMALTATKKARKPYTVKPLVVEDAAAVMTADLIAAIEAAATKDALKEITASKRAVNLRARLKEARPELADQVDAAVAAALARLEQPA